VKAFEIVRVGKRACRSQDAARDIMSAISSCAEFGNTVICSRKGYVQAALRSTCQSPACHSGAAANMRAVLCFGKRIESCHSHTKSG
jgi:hypothetical protein